MFRHVKNIHFIGVGGIGMSGIAEVLSNLGFNVSGSDLNRSKNTERLEKVVGVKVFEGHSERNIGDAEVVVYSSAIKQDNPEIVAARDKKIPVIPRAEMLAELMTLKPYSVAVSGSHGKTSTTSMVATVLGHAGIDPTTIVGGVVDTLGSNAKLGDSEWFVTEADESDRSFLMLYPTIAVVTNIDREHMESYSGMEDVFQCFTDFVNKVPFYGAAILCMDDHHVQSIIPNVTRRVVTYGFSKQADVSAGNIEFNDTFGSRFKVLSREGELGEIELPVPGRHNVYNALAAIAVALELDIEFPKIAEAFKHFKNADRRFQYKGTVNDITLFDDYGHHPTEITATLEAAKNSAGGRRIVVVFQPHRYSRTKDLMEEFATSFNNADMVYISDIYPASEKPIEGITAEVLAEKIVGFGHRGVRYIGGIETAAEFVSQELAPNDLVITLGAGSITKLSDDLLEKIKTQNA
ncbi:MAG: UDP-N-acetylmuramate--L-alanine ligase [Acidobacteria bacterium]|nr:MAG: UDP-N-acetylmuramate--L-alanine ligase [Acidobacteriota bacterium]REK02301.1 MAG: UDP-N-acetylmuramate--L-alanine ligase [Acidobacteriota bacterium]REK13896.1 MAG: UDP-N-acetylmuramate--L-alanine ligase [Acidobacteriota bacterium]REK41890.1 MAG: UDP-N-acetylmuramate--L-alanine ligase [Acidobacteriota bacterium]